MTMEMVLIFAMFTIGVVAIVAMYFFMRSPVETSHDNVKIDSRSKASPDSPWQRPIIDPCPATANSEPAQDSSERESGKHENHQSSSFTPRSNPIRFSLPPGSRWGGVSLYLVDGHNLSVKLPDQRAITVNFMQMDMNSKQNHSPTVKWQILVSLCEGYGSCGWKTISNSFDAFKTQVSGLRSQLQQIFDLADDPFSACTKEDGLRAKFQAFPDAPGRSRVPFISDVPALNASDSDPA
jgi:hypothetical protein